VKSPTKWYSDNLGMLQSSSIPESTLKKRHVKMAYHMCREQVASKILTPIKVKTGENVADTAMKALKGGALDHRNKIIFVRPFQTEHQIKLHRMRVWYETLKKT
jgi:hypothetical protein